MKLKNYLIYFFILVLTISACKKEEIGNPGPWLVPADQVLSGGPGQNGGTILAEDIDGNKLDIFGEVIEGPHMGEKLKVVSTYMGYWFSWGTFYSPSIYGE